MHKNEASFEDRLKDCLLICWLRFYAVEKIRVIRKGLVTTVKCIRNGVSLYSRLRFIDFLSGLIQFFSWVKIGQNKIV